MTISHPAPRRRSAPKTPPASAPLAKTPERAPSLYELGLGAQAIAGEIAIAAELLGSEDPDEQAQAVALLESYLLAEERNRSALEAKADNICQYISSISAKAAFRKAEAQRLADLAAADAKRAEHLKTYMVKVLTALNPGERKFSLPLHELSSRSSTVVVIDDPDLLPEDLMRTTTKVEPDKATIKAALAGGVEVPGAHLEQRTNWSIK